VKTKYAVSPGTPLEALGPAEESRLFDRGRSGDEEVARSVAATLADVRARGDDALIEQALRFDGVAALRVEVPLAECRDALAALDPLLRSALEEAARNIAGCHRAQLPVPVEVEVRPGVRVGRRPDPLRRVAVYAPGGRAAYPSSVLMGAIPARIAGVDEVVVCSPPGPDGRPPAAVLAACALAGADRVFALGGAGAVAAVTYGTRTVPAVDKIVGPGNVYVTEAKRQVSGLVAVDLPAGPSEVLVLADGTADPRRVAAELLAQAEHDPDAASVLVTTSARVLEGVVEAMDEAVALQRRRAIVEASLAARGALLLASSEREMLEFAARYAPEHLALYVEDARRVLGEVRNAGAVFLGDSTSVAFGDYLTGGNHVLPTGGMARGASGLGTLDFVRWTSYQEVGPDAAARLAPMTAVFADAEGLPAHAAAARMREPASGPLPERDSDERADASSGWRSGGHLPSRRAYRSIELYDPRRAPCEVDLSDNTNRFGIPPAATRVIAALSDAAVSRYPSVYADRLKLALAALHGVDPSNVVTGCGSDDVIDSAIRAFCEPGEPVAFPSPTFGVVSTFARMNAARPLPLPMRDGITPDPAALLAAAAPIAYLCSPNNPTGAIVDGSTLERLDRDLPGVLLLDEAYADFGDADRTAASAGSARTVSLRTLSKAYGLAGLRIGYAVGPADLVREIEKSRGPYKVSAIAEAVACAVLEDDRGWVAGRVAEAREIRTRLAGELARRGLIAPPSAANFLLVRLPAGVRADAIAAAVRARGVGVRPFAALPSLGDCVRVTVGPWWMMERFLAALDEALSLEAA
jgi:histidinol dehydrogenase